MADQVLPPNQVWGKRFVIYAALGVPRIDQKQWRLKVDGLVRTPLEYTYDQLTSVPQDNLTRSFHCLVPDILVYANPEPKEISNVRVGDAIIGADGKKHIVRKLIRKDHSGDIVGVKAAYLPPSMMTPDHPVYTIRAHPGLGRSGSERRQRTFSNNPTPSWVPADKLNLGDYVFFPKYRQTSRRKFISIGKKSFRIDEQLASILGWYVAEGSGSESGGNGVAFALNSGEENHVLDVRRLLSGLFEARTSVYANARRTPRRIVAISSSVPGLLATLKSWCGNDEDSKRIPDFIMDAEPKVLRAFLVSYLKGNGYAPHLKGRATKHDDFIDFSTSSRTLAYQLILALSKLSIPAELVNHPGSMNDGFSVRARGEKVKELLSDFPTFAKINKFHYWETNNGFYYPITKLWRERYTGPVYDFQAPGFTMLSPFVTQDCVTKWSIKDVLWEGLQLRKLLEPAGVAPDADWLMFHCADGYSAPVPLEVAMMDDSILAFRLNGKPLSAEQGFPARPFIPGLYAWKSAKWVNRMELMSGYRDGYWEAYGYHEKADVWEEERFKGHSGTPVKRRAIGTA